MTQRASTEFGELLNKYLDENKMYHFEGNSGVKNLCRLVRAIGYRDVMNFGQFDYNASYGDLFTFLEDNPGAIDCLVGWIEKNGTDEWVENLESHLPEEDEDEEDDDNES